MTELASSAYAPYNDPEDYILSWTDKIWEARGMGQIRDHYMPDLRVHGAYGTITGSEQIIQASLQKNAAYPHRSFTGEDVVWEVRDENTWLSSHRILNCGRQEGHWQYGPPTFQHTVSRNIAVCLVRDAMVAEEWVVRDEWSVVEQSGHDIDEIARGIAFAPNSGLLGDRPEKLLGEAPKNPLVKGVSGTRPDLRRDEDDHAVAMIDEVWNQHLGNLVPDYFCRDIVINTTRNLTFAREDGYKEALDRLFAPFPDAQVEVYDVAFNEDAFHGTRVSVTWVLRGSYSGTPLYGPVTNSPIEILGVSQFQFRHGKIIREWRVYDELAVLAQIKKAQGADPR
ncbi:ester cyclase [Streptomyces sp. NBC_00006]|uniref:nuclear transport factor 2 family protein n=1 Tax=Streptomyces sp. NBC_00006 TaxID=2975619 RepID=UPI002257D4CB|nr:ester cyclase [Streptomyces sp. NBC_00006]MCX5535848.1 ester cyclase [Streptomyces sp. NBC_00006]